MFGKGGIVTLILAIIYVLVRSVLFGYCAFYFMNAWHARDIPDMVGYGLLALILLQGAR